MTESLEVLLTVGIAGLVAGLVVGIARWLLDGWLTARGVRERRAVPMVTMGIIGAAAGALGVFTALTVVEWLRAR